MLTESFIEPKFLTLVKVSLSVISFIVPLVSYLKSHCQTQDCLDFFSAIFSEFYSFAFYI